MHRPKGGGGGGHWRFDPQPREIYLKSSCNYALDPLTMPSFHGKIWTLGI